MVCRVPKENKVRVENRVLQEMMDQPVYRGRRVFRVFREI
jgi:hypothetical protein